VARLADGSAVAVSRTAAALADDCFRAALIVTLRAVPADCAAKVLDRKVLRDNGAMALTRRGGNFEAISARPEGFDRPWTRRRQADRNQADRNQSDRNVTAPNAIVPAAMAVPRDATPPQPDGDAEQ
jgi:competence protein ComEC